VVTRGRVVRHQRLWPAGSRPPRGSCPAGWSPLTVTAKRWCLPSAASPGSASAGCLTPGALLALVNFG